ncbi:alkaline phosphatase [Zooshikella ganghwensis]|uniref:Alkaline phosphatase n=2 Tax=Zooshikella ganghwensis TaxID=202772 RepID=A0A4P9VWG0_9GAMM|nr:alkaline phosphatase [Zooshikella ganghwensis]
MLSVCGFAANGAKKVLLVGIDGVQYEHILKLNTPAFDRLNITKAYTGGVAGNKSEQKTISGPGWTTILTGVWKNKHGVVSNTHGLANSQWPSIYRYLHDANRQFKLYGFSTWGPIHSQFFKNDMPFLSAHAEGGSDDDNLNRTLKVLYHDSPDFIFLHLDEPDAAGHSHGFGQAYDDSIIRSDNRLGMLLDAVAQREQVFAENWLVLVTTDHGRDFMGKGHGGQTKQEKTIFIASNKPLNKNYQSIITLPNKHFGGLYGLPAQTYIVPTILNYFGVMSDIHWRLDGLPLVGDIKVNRIYADIGGKKCGLEWDMSTGSPSTLGANEHVAKFDCDGNADPLFIKGNKIYANIFNSGCTLQWDADKGTPLTLEENEHVAKFDCTDFGDPLQINDQQITSYINDQLCGFQWDSDAGTPITLGRNEHVAKFDCEGSPDQLVIE